MYHLVSFITQEKINKYIYNLQKQVQDHTLSQTKTECQREQLLHSQYQKRFRLTGCRLLHPTVPWLVLSMPGPIHQRLEYKNDINITGSYLNFSSNKKERKKKKCLRNSAIQRMYHINNGTRKARNHKVFIIKTPLTASIISQRE